MMLNLCIRGAFAIFVLKVEVCSNLITVAYYLKFKNVNSTSSVKHMGFFYLKFTLSSIQTCTLETNLRITDCSLHN